MKKILIILLILIIAYLINIPPYIELNDLAIIETIAIEEKDNLYTLYLKEVIPTKNENGIDYEYKYYQETATSIKTALENIKTSSNKNLYLFKTKKLITNIKNTETIKKELDIKPNSIIHTNNIEKKLKS